MSQQKFKPYAESEGVRKSWSTFLSRQISEDERGRFARALQDSLRIDMNGEDVPAPLNPSSIRKQYGYNYTAQVNLGLSLQKPLAEIFLREINCPTITRGFKNVYNAQSYKERFERDPIIIHKKQLLLTYAEWLHFVDHSIRVDLPDDFASYL